MMMYNPTDLNKTIANWIEDNEDELRIEEFSSMPDMPMLVTHIKFVINDKYDVELESYILDIEYIDDEKLGLYVNKIKYIHIDNIDYTYKSTDIEYNLIYDDETSSTNINRTVNRSRRNGVTDEGDVIFSIKLAYTKDTAKDTLRITKIMTSHYDADNYTVTIDTLKNKEQYRIIKTAKGYKNKEYIDSSTIIDFKDDTMDTISITESVHGNSMISKNNLKRLNNIKSDNDLVVAYMNNFTTIEGLDNNICTGESLTIVSYDEDNADFRYRDASMDNNGLEYNDSYSLIKSEDETLLGHIVRDNGIIKINKYTLDPDTNEVIDKQRVISITDEAVMTTKNIYDKEEITPDSIYYAALVNDDNSISIAFSL